MIIIPFIVKLIFQNLIFWLFGYFLSFLEFLIALFQVIIDITRIVPSSGASMLAPLLEAEPAKVVVAFLTLHVHTPLIFLDQAGAFGTRLGVSFYPSNVFAITALFFHPDFDHGAGWWKMVLVLTREAVGKLAFALDCVFESVYCFLSHIIASFLRTPFYIFVLICHLLAVPVQIFFTVVDTIFRNLVLQVLEEKRVRNYNIAP